MDVYSVATVCAGPKKYYQTSVKVPTTEKKMTQHYFQVFVPQNKTRVQVRLKGVSFKVPTLRFKVQTLSVLTTGILFLSTKSLGFRIGRYFGAIRG